MGFWSSLLSSIGRDTGSAVFTPRVEYLGAEEFGAWAGALGDVSQMTAAEMWRTQPHFRTVVTFMARNVAQLGLHCFERVDDTDRRRDRTSPLAMSIDDVDGTMTTYELIFALVGDLALYDRAYWWVAPSSDMPSGWMIRRLPPTWVDVKMSNPWEVKEYRVFLPGNGGGFTSIPPDKILAFPGYAPGKMHGSSPTVDSLRATLQEQIEAAKYRGQVWKRGGRVSAVLQRPLEAPTWTPDQAERFREDWYANYAGHGPRAGGTPILEDGMTLNRIDFNAQEQQYVEAAKLSMGTVAAAFHVNPTMVGQMDNANYSNVRELRKMLYGDTLGPQLAQIESRVNRFMVPMLGMDRHRFYVEFNIAEKLQGNFEEQSAALQSATGAPWLTRNEARARQNLPALPSGDDLVVPLNVLVGGQSSPNDSGDQNRRSPAAPRVKARAADDWDTKATRALADFFERQERAVRSRLGAKADADWWDGDRWNDELAGTLGAISVAVAAEIGPRTAKSLGFDADDYDEARTLAFLKAVSERRAEAVNEATRAQIEAALASEDPGDSLDSVWNVAKGQRSSAAGAALVTAASAFATTEAARQVSGGKATKTWNTGPNARDSHAAMNGETVGIDDTFSNGMAWPGDGSDADEIAGCNCSVSVEVPQEGS